MHDLLLRKTLFLLICVGTMVGSTHQKSNAAGSMHLSIDCSKPTRGLIEAKVTIPVAVTSKAGKVSLWYPKWVPGSHGPGGPIANIAGLQVHNIDGERLNWRRAPGEVYRLEVDVPPGTKEVHVSLRYVTNQPTTTSFGHDCFFAGTIGVVSPSCLLLYPDGVDIDEQKIGVSVRLPDQWQLASALATSENEVNAENEISFQPVSLRTLVDSPMMLGKHYRSVGLVTNSSVSPPHVLHVFSDDEAAESISDEVVKKYAEMVKQTSYLIGSHPFDRFDILLGVTDSLPKNGLEHARSTFNVLPPSSLKSVTALKGWDRLLVPHEYLHAWCGKYRRPDGMLTSDFHTAKDTELLWVYEGLTQYLGELVEARCGLMSHNEFKNRLLVELRNATNQQGRQWRTLADTAAASHTLRAASPSWGGLRRSQDYYMEGMLFWLEADARIRHLTNGKKSLDDFCHSFFKAKRSVKQPVAFDRSEVVRQLQSVVRFDWDGLIARRIESFQQQFDPEVASLLGYRFGATSQKPKIPANTFRQRSGVDLLDSLGLAISPSGVIRNVLLDSPADKAMLAPQLSIVAVGDHKWSEKRMLDSIKNAVNGDAIKLLISDHDRIKSVQIQYYQGLRYWDLTREESKNDWLSEILKPRSN
jgi:predicted metalloprotease with PDZ domain